MSERLWACHRCKMVGSGFAASRHVDETGHQVDQLDQVMSDAVRAAQLHQAAPTAADFVIYAHFREQAKRG